MQYVLPCKVVMELHWCREYLWGSFVLDWSHVLKTESGQFRSNAPQWLCQSYLMIKRWVLTLFLVTSSDHKTQRSYPGRALFKCLYSLSTLWLMRTIFTAARMVMALSALKAGHGNRKTKKLQILTALGLLVDGPVTSYYLVFILCEVNQVLSQIPM